MDEVAQLNPLIKMKRWRHVIHILKESSILDGDDGKALRLFKSVTPVCQIFNIEMGIVFHERVYGWADNFAGSKLSQQWLNISCSLSHTSMLICLRVKHVKCKIGE